MNFLNLLNEMARVNLPDGRSFPSANIAVVELTNQGLGKGEIANLLGTTVATVSSIQSVARRNGVLPPLRGEYAAPVQQAQQGQTVRRAVTAPARAMQVIDDTAYTYSPSYTEQSFKTECANLQKYVTLKYKFLIHMLDTSIRSINDNYYQILSNSFPTIQHRPVQYTSLLGNSATQRMSLIGVVNQIVGGERVIALADAHGGVSSKIISGSNGPNGNDYFTYSVSNNTFSSAVSIEHNYPVYAYTKKYWNLRYNPNYNLGTPYFHSASLSVRLSNVNDDIISLTADDGYKNKIIRLSLPSFITKRVTYRRRRFGQSVNYSTETASIEFITISQENFDFIYDECKKIVSEYNKVHKEYLQHYKDLIHGMQVLYSTPVSKSASYQRLTQFDEESYTSALTARITSENYNIISINAHPAKRFIDAIDFNIKIQLNTPGVSGGEDEEDSTANPLHDIVIKALDHSNSPMPANINELYDILTTKMPPYKNLELSYKPSGECNIKVVISDRVL